MRCRVSQAGDPDASIVSRFFEAKSSIPGRKMPEDVLQHSKVIVPGMLRQWYPCMRYDHLVLYAMPVDNSPVELSKRLHEESTCNFRRARVPGLYCCGFVWLVVRVRVLQNYEIRGAKLAKQQRAGLQPCRPSSRLMDMIPDNSIFITSPQYTRQWDCRSWRTSTPRLSPPDLPQALMPMESRQTT